MIKEEKMKRDEALFKCFLENSPDLFWIISPDFEKFYYLSPNVEKICDFKREELATPEDWLSKIVFHKDKNKAMDGVKTVLSTLKPVRFDYRIRLKNGSLRWVRDLAFPLKLQNDEIYVAGITRDISNVKMHEMRRDLRHDLSQILAHASSLSDAMPKILSTICLAWDWKIGTFWILDQQKKVLHFYSSWHVDEKTLNAFESKCRELSFAEGDFFIGQSLTEQKAIFQKEITKIPEFLRGSCATQAGLHDACVFPIKLKDTMFGALEFLNDEIEVMDKYSLDFFTDLGVLIGNYIDKTTAKEQLAKSEEFFKNAFNHSMIGMAVTCIEGSFFGVNHSLCDFLGFSRNELLQRNYKDLIYPDDLAKNSNMINQLIGGIIPSFQASVRLMLKSGNYSWVIMSAALVRDTNNLPVNIIFQIQDVSYVQSLKEKLVQLAQYDVVTRLPNQQLLEHVMQQSLLVTSLSQKKAVIFVIDIDRLKLMNAPLDQEIVDKVFLEVGQVLNTQIQPKDIVARLEGGEFAIVVSGISNEHDIQRTLNNITESIKRPVQVDGQQHYLTASIGAAIFPDDAIHAHELVNKSYTAMQEEKKRGEFSCLFFSNEMLQEEQENLKIELGLRDAILNNELSLRLQPIFELKTGMITSAEVLLRWQSKILGEVSPAKFIPIAEKSGQIVELGKWILENAAQIAREMTECGMPPIQLAINLSPRQLLDDQFFGCLTRIFQNFNVEQRQLRFEITENQLIENLNSVSSLIPKLKALGFDFSIDDFGIGYSSFNYLRKFVADSVKIDSSFIHNIDSDPKNAAITSAIVAMCQKLEIIPIAEGIETQKELDYLKSIGCSEGQGFFLSHPLSFEDFLDFLKTHPVIRPLA